MTRARGGHKSQIGATHPAVQQLPSGRTSQGQPRSEREKAQSAAGSSSSTDNKQCPSPKTPFPRSMECLRTCAQPRYLQGSVRTEEGSKTAQENIEQGVNVLHTSPDRRARLSASSATMPAHAAGPAARGEQGATSTQTPFPPNTHRALGQVGQGDAEQPPPGSADQQGRDEDPRGHREAIRPAGQEEIHQGEHPQRHGVVGTWGGEKRVSAGSTARGEQTAAAPDAHCQQTKPLLGAPSSRFSPQHPP